MHENDAVARSREPIGGNRREEMGREIDADGFAIHAGVSEVEELRSVVSTLSPTGEAGRRWVLAIPMVAALARSNRLLDLLRPHFSAEPFPIRAVLFDKSQETNWVVPWHQDLMVAVRERVDLPGFEPWSIKDGVPHVQPPVELLERMLTVRLHFDDADETNGALRVLPGSHRCGRLSARQIQEWRKERADLLCAVPAGGALLMRPLLLHASGRSTSARRRRVLHIEYADFGLPGGLEWAETG